MLSPINTANYDSQPTSAEVEVFNQIKRAGNKKEQLKKVASEFESVFVTKMISLLDKTVEKEDGVFGQEGNFLKNFKSFMFAEMGREIAQNPRTSFGFASQIYKQMEKSLGE